MSKLLRIAGMLSLACAVVAFFTMTNAAAAFFFCLLGLALGAALLEISELHERVRALEELVRQGQSDPNNHKPTEANKKQTEAAQSAVTELSNAQNIHQIDG